MSGWRGARRAAAVGAWVGVALGLLGHRARVEADLAGPTPRPPPSDAPLAATGPQPNVVLVIGCTVRRDQVSAYGGAAATTPFLAELAARGARFTDGHTASAWTRASAASLLTGRPFRELGMAEPGPGPNQRRLPPGALTLAERFSSAGYATVGATANPNLNAVFGFDQGFSAYRETDALYRDGQTKIPGARVVDQALAAVDERTPGAPLYLQLLLVDAHQPGTVSSAEAARFSEGGGPSRVLKYRAMLHRFDRAVHRLWNGLAARGFDDDNTVFVVVNDHGEGLQWPPEQGVGHGNFLSPAVTDLVWLVRGRGVGAGVQVDGLSSQVDVAPTLAALAGLASAPGPGRDWSSLLAAGGVTDRARAFIDTDFERADKVAVVSADRACELNGRHDPPDVACYDRRADPHHRTPLTRPVDALVTELRAWRDAQRAAAATADVADAVLTPADRDLLRQLGYLEEGAPE